jgi:pimeloyl-ACP methyl ester carboxylesterase
MARKLLIVHGYSDGSTSFTGLADYFVSEQLYKRKDIWFVDYSSMDDQATFRDFADKLNDDYHRICPEFEQVDVACHSTGALVTRAWLALHAVRNQKHGMNRPCPVRHLLMFAPANFGSDLAAMGQSFLGKTRTTFFNSHSHKTDFMESGREVLQGLEPASPLQWELSHYDLHGRKGAYFNPAHAEQHRCYPFIFAAGCSYTGLQARLLKNRAKPGTDGTVRISGTSLNTRKCHFSFDGNTGIQWVENSIKYNDIPFAVFNHFNHGNIINATGRNFNGKDRPGPLACEALQVETLQDYYLTARKFRQISADNYAMMDEPYRDQYQQFFFKVRDDVGLPVEDFFIDFYVQHSNGKLHTGLTAEFDDNFESSFYRHTADSSCRAMLLNCRELGAFKQRLDQIKARLVFDITAASRLPDISYKPGYHVIYDGKGHTTGSEPTFIYPNTTTLVDIIINRNVSDKLLNVKDYSTMAKR